MLALGLTLAISACVVQPRDTEDFFEKSEIEELVTLDGEIYPFSVSISTRATHRLANIDGKLIAYLYSDIVDLQSFENRVVEVDGYWRREQMQEIFFVEAIRLQDMKKDAEISDFLPNRFETKRFTFVYPPHWSYSQSPDGVAHFVDKSDITGLVFLLFSVNDITSEDLAAQPNISVAGMKGIRNITTDRSGKERQEISILSNLYNKNYHFTLIGGTEDRKKDFLRLINSFIEGEESVKTVIDNEKRILAEREASKLKKIEEVVLQLDPLESDTPGDISENLDQPDTDLGEEPETVDTAIVEKEDPVAGVESKEDQKIYTDKEKQLLLGNDFVNLIDEGALSYQTDYYNLKMKVPFGFWFRNFGPGNGYLFRVGFATEEISTEASVEYWLYVVSSDTVLRTVQERIEGEQLIIEFPRTNNSFFRFVGPVEYRDAMRSILLTIE